MSMARSSLIPRTELHAFCAVCFASTKQIFSQRCPSVDNTLPVLLLPALSFGHAGDRKLYPPLQPDSKTLGFFLGTIFQVVLPLVAAAVFGCWASFLSSPQQQTPQEIILLCFLTTVGLVAAKTAFKYHGPQGYDFFTEFPTAPIIISAQLLLHSTSADISHV